MAWAATSEAEVLELARETALPTHNRERGIVGAQAVALAIWLARQGATKDAVRQKVAALSGYDLDRTVAEIRPGYRFQVGCDLSVPEAIICALEADSWEGAVRLAVSLGGDADTQAAIAGGIAEGWWGAARDVRVAALGRLTSEMQGVATAFEAALSSAST